MPDIAPQQPDKVQPAASHKKQWIIICGAIAALLVAGGFVWWLMAKPNPAAETPAPKKVTVSQVCTPAIIREANAPLEDNDQVALAPVVDKIRALKGFDSDPNCLYIVLQYNLAAGDDKASADYMEKLDQVYDPVVGYSSAFTVSIIPMKELRKDVDFLKRNADEAEANQKLSEDRLSEGSDMADKFHREHPQQ